MFTYKNQTKMNIDYKKKLKLTIIYAPPEPFSGTGPAELKNQNRSVARQRQLKNQNLQWHGPAAAEEPNQPMKIQAT